MSLIQSASFTNTSNPLRSTRLPSDAYVLSLAALPSRYAASASAPSNEIYLFDSHSLRPAQSLYGHEGGTTSLRAVDAIVGTNQRSLVSSGKDGTVKVWDDRAGTVAVQMSLAGRPRALLCADVSPDGMTVAAGTAMQSDEALILYWDPRSPVAPLRTHASTHSDDITALHFLRPSSSTSSSAPSHPRTLLSASSDGLVSISNADEEDEDEAVIQVSNWGCSISQAGWFHQNRGRSRCVWAASDMETFSTWTHELDQRQDLDIRSPSVHTAQNTWVTDYLVGCHMSDTSGLGVFVGSNEGDIALIRNADYEDREASWALERVWSTGHSGVVRSMLWDERHNVLLTGGEDAQIHLWSAPAIPAGSSSEDDIKMEGEEDDGMGSLSPSGRKRLYDHEGDVEMGDVRNDSKKLKRG